MGESNQPTSSTVRRWMQSADRFFPGFSLLKETLHYFRAFRRHIGRGVYVAFLLTGLVALTEGLGIALILPLLHAFDAGGVGESYGEGRVQEFLFGLVRFFGISESVLGILLLIGAVFGCKAGLKFGEGVFKGYLRSRVLRDLKIRLVDGYSRMTYEYYVRRSTGHFLNLINTQVNGLFAAFRGFTVFGTCVINAVLYVGLATLLAWRFALFALVVGLILVTLFRWLNRYVARLSHKVATEVGVAGNLIVQAVHGFKYIVATNQTPRLRRDVNRSVERYTKFGFRQMLASAFTQAVQEPLAVVLVLAIVAIQVVLLDASLAPILVSLLLFYRSIGYIIGVQGGWLMTLNKIASVDLVEKELKANARRREPDGAYRLEPFSGRVEFRDVFFAYEGSSGPVLEDVSLTIRAKTTVAFVGPSGAGKSTLIDLLTLMLRPTKGEVLIEGVPGDAVQLASWRTQIGFVPQEFFLFDDTVANNISLWDGDYEADGVVRDRIHQAAAVACADEFIEALPQKYQTVVGDRGVKLSGGQRQRLFIARELYKNPRLLIMDEATSALDSESERNIQQSLERLKGKITIVLIAHRLSTIKSADYLYVLEKGKVVEHGTYQELSSGGRRFQKMVEMQQL